MDHNGQVAQFPCPMEQSGQMVWSLANNACPVMQSTSDSWDVHLMYNEGSAADGETSQQQSIFPESCKDALSMGDVEVEHIPSAPKIGTWFKKLPAVAEEPGAAVVEADA